LLFHCIVTNLHLPHDALFKFGFSDTERAADEFRSILPPALVHKIDWEALERIDGTEHQSQADPMMPYRMLRYVDRALWSHVAAHGNTLPLPAAILILLHLSESGWTKATNMHQLFDEGFQRRHGEGQNGRSHAIFA